MRSHSSPRLKPGASWELPGEQYCDRYATEAAALAGHDQAVSWLRGKLGGVPDGDVIPAEHLAGAVVPPDDISGLLA